MSKFPLLSVPATRSSASALGAKRRLVVGVLVAIMLFGPLALLFAVRADHKAGAVVVPKPPTREIAIAQEAGEDFLNFRVSHVPTATGVDADFSKDGDGHPVPAAKRYSVTSFVYSGFNSYDLGDANHQTLVFLIRFRVVLGGVPYNLDVPVSEGAASPALAGTPTLLPAAQGDIGANSADYGQLYTATAPSLPQNVQDSIAGWLAAYTKGGVDDPALQAVTGDQNPADSYTGLGGWSGEVRGFGPPLPVGGPGTGKPGGLIVNVSVVLHPPAATGPSLRTSYDLYVVTEGDPKLPPVIAWGPAGSAEDLSPSSNVNK